MGRKRIKKKRTAKVLQPNGTTDPHAVAVYVDRKLMLTLATMAFATGWPKDRDVTERLDIPVGDPEQPSNEWCVEFAIRSFFGAIGYED